MSVRMSNIKELDVIVKIQTFKKDKSTQYITKIITEYLIHLLLHLKVS